MLALQKYGELYTLYSAIMQVRRTKTRCLLVLRYLTMMGKKDWEQCLQRERQSWNILWPAATVSFRCFSAAGGSENRLQYPVETDRLPMNCPQWLNQAVYSD